MGRRSSSVWDVRKVWNDGQSFWARYLLFLVVIPLERALKLLVGSHGSITIAMGDEQPQPAAGPPGTTAYMLGVRLESA